MLTQFIDPPTKLTEPPIQIYPRVTKYLDIETIEQDIKTDYEESSPYQESAISETYQTPD